MNALFVILLCVLASINTLASTRHGEAFTTVYSASGACIAFKDAYDIFPPEETWFDELTGTVLIAETFTLKNPSFLLYAY